MRRRRAHRWKIMLRPCRDAYGRAVQDMDWHITRWHHEHPNVTGCAPPPRGWISPGKVKERLEAIWNSAGVKNATRKNQFRMW